MMYAYCLCCTHSECGGVPRPKMKITRDEYVNKAIKRLFSDRKIEKISSRSM